VNDDLPRVRKEEIPLRSHDAHSLLKGFAANSGIRILDSSFAWFGRLG
jgi:hypothetical protein